MAHLGTHHGNLTPVLGGDHHIIKRGSPAAGHKGADGGQGFPSMAWGQEGDGVGLRHRLLTRGIGGKTGGAIGQKMHHAAVGGNGFRPLVAVYTLVAIGDWSRGSLLQWD